MIAKAQDTLARWHLRLTRISLASWIFHWIGSFLVGSPAGLKQAPWFWFDNEERKMPTKDEYLDPKVQMAQVGGEVFRRKLKRDLTIYTFVLSFAACVVIFLMGKAAIAMVMPGSQRPSIVSAPAVSMPVQGAVSENGKVDCEQIRKQRAQIETRFDDLKASFMHMGPEDQQVITYSIQNCEGKSL